MSSNCTTTSTGSPAAPPQCFQNDKNVYKCDLCCKFFKSKIVLAKHMTPFHIERERWCTRIPSPESYEGMRKLHPPSCTQSPYDLDRMKRLAKEEPYLIFSNTQFDFKQGVHKFKHETSPLWHAFKRQHVACFKFILEAASKKENIKFEDGSSKVLSYCQLINQQILADFLRNGVDENKTFEMLKALLEHGVSPNLEIPVSEMPAYNAKQILTNYKAKTLIFPSPTLHMAITRNSPKILSLLLRHGAYPDPMILTELGDVLPLYPTLGKHLNPIPIIADKNIIEPCHLLLKILHTDFTSSRYTVVTHGGIRQVDGDRGRLFSKGRQIKIDLLITLLAHGASLSPYQVKGGGEFMALETVFSESLLDSYRWSRQEDELMELFKVYLGFGGTPWEKSNFTAISVQVHPVVDPNPELVGQEQAAEFIIQLSDVYNERSRLIERELGELNSMPINVHSLQHACRITIWRVMANPSVRNVDSLPLPKRLINYIKFETKSNI